MGLMSRTRWARAGGALLACLISVLICGQASAHTLRAPSGATVSYTDVDNMVATLSPGLSSADGFIKATIRGDFACPVGHWVRQVAVRTPYDFAVKSLPTTKGHIVGNVLLPAVLLASHPELHLKLVGGASNTSGQEHVPITLYAVCVNPREASFSKGVRVVSDSKTITVAATSNKPVYGGVFAVPAQATPYRFRHRCPNAGRTRVSSRMRPTQCGATYDPKNPVLSEPAPVVVKLKCPYQGLTFVGFGRAHGQASVNPADPSNISSFGKLLMCHLTRKGSDYHSAPKYPRAGALRANFLTNPPTIQVYHGPRLQLFQQKAPKRVASQICKRADFRVTRDLSVISVFKGDVGEDCNKAMTIEYDVPIADVRDSSKISAWCADDVRRVCESRARQLKASGQWTSMPASGAGRRFRATGAFTFDLAARFCHQPRPWRKRKWYEIFSYHESIKYSCSSFGDTAWWYSTLSAPFAVTCIQR